MQTMDKNLLSSVLCYIAFVLLFTSCNEISEGTSVRRDKCNAPKCYISALEYTDSLGNITESYAWEYKTIGEEKVLHRRHGIWETDHDYIEYLYNGAGQISQANIIEYDTILRVSYFPSYNEAGNLKSIGIQNYYPFELTRINFSYNDQNQLIETKTFIDERLDRVAQYTGHTSSYQATERIINDRSGRTVSNQKLSYGNCSNFTIFPSENVVQAVSITQPEFLSAASCKRGCPVLYKTLNDSEGKTISTCEYRYQVNGLLKNYEIKYANDSMQTIFIRYECD